MSKVEKENLVVKHNALINATSKYKYETNLQFCRIILPFTN